MPRPPGKQYPYVYWHEPTSRWFGRLRLSGRLVHLGFYETAFEASQAVNKTLQELGLAVSGEEFRGRRKSRATKSSLERYLEELALEKELDERAPADPVKRVEGVWEEDKPREGPEPGK